MTPQGQWPGAHAALRLGNTSSFGIVVGSQIARFYLEEYKTMPLINIVIGLIIVGMGLWLINRFIPMASSIKTILNVVVVVFVGVWVLQVTGLWGPISSYRLTR
jgi:hypothetical protein